MGWGGGCKRSLYLQHAVEATLLTCSSGMNHRMLWGGVGGGVGWGMLTFLVLAACS